MKYDQNIFIYIPFLSNLPTDQTAHHIFALDDSNDMDSRKGVVDIAAHLGDQISPKTPILGHDYVFSRWAIFNFFLPDRVDTFNETAKIWHG